TPEKGWKRFENANSNIKYVGAFVAGGEITYSTLPLSVAGETKVEFKFSGTKLRLIGAKSTNYSEELGCRIDGKEYIFTQKGQSKNKTVDLEVLNLENKIHEVEIYNVKLGSYGLVLDAVDVDEDGALIETKADKIELDKYTMNVFEGASRIITPKLAPKKVTNEKIIWKTNDSAIAQINENGVVKGIKEGQAIITAISEGSNIQVECKINVVKVPNLWNVVA
ncbi:Ig-like domain-containing protein, partial [Clostridium gasigenes]|uniref:Ig-like domain-containing protein n=1 Tax=Clostridium gasigenes TaxID=94869 RepID=UPI001C0AA8BE